MDWFDWSDSRFWLLLGLAGQVAFASRFLLQWVASEMAGESRVPKSFWYLSIAGSLALLAYAVHRRDPIFTLAYLPNTFVYLRNLMLIRRKEREEATARPATLGAEAARAGG